MSDERDSGDRPRLSWREIDQRRDRPRHASDEQRPRGPGAEKRARAATQRYLKEIDRAFFAPGGSRTPEERRLADAVREAQGTPHLAEACRAYLAALGPPQDAALLAAFLDARAPDVVRAALEALGERATSGALELTPGLRSQLRLLESEADDEIAELAEEILERL